MVSAGSRALAALACLAWCAAAPPAPAQEDAAEGLEILRSLAPRAGQTEAPRYIAEGVQFDYASDRLTAEARGTLDRMARALRSTELGGLRFRIEGHTDSRGSAAYNMDLSVRRARAVAAYLAEVRGFAAARFDMVGHGESRPRDPTNPEGAINRRVEIVTLVPPPAPTAPPPPQPETGDRPEESFVRDVLTGDGG